MVLPGVDELVDDIVSVLTESLKAADFSDITKTISSKISDAIDTSGLASKITTAITTGDFTKNISEAIATAVPTSSLASQISGAVTTGIPTGSLASQISNAVTTGIPTGILSSQISSAINTGGIATAISTPVIDTISNLLTSVISDMNIALNTVPLSSVSPVPPLYAGTHKVNAFNLMSIHKPTIHTYETPYFLLDAGKPNAALGYSGDIPLEMVDRAPLASIPLRADFSMIGDVLNKISQIIGTKLISVITDNFTQITVPAISDGITQLVPTIEQGLQSLYPAINQAVEGLLPVVQQVIMGTIPTINDGISSLVSPISDVITSLVPSIGDSVMSLVPIINEMLTQIAATMFELFNTAGANIVSSITSAMGEIGRNAPSLLGCSSVKLSAGFDDFTSGITGIGKYLSKGIFGEVVSRMTGIGGDFATGVLDKVMSVFDIIGPQLYDNIQSFGTDVGQKIMNFITPVLIGGGKAASGSLKLVIGMLRNLIKSVLTNVVNIVCMTVVNSVTTSKTILVDQILNNALNQISSIKSSVMSQAKNLSISLINMTRQMVNKGTDAVQTTSAGIQGEFQAVASEVFNTVRSSIFQVENISSSVIPKVLEVKTQALSTVTKLSRDLVDSFADIFSFFYTQIDTIAQDAIKNATAAMTTVASPLTNIQGMLKFVKDNIIIILLLVAVIALIVGFRYVHLM